MRELIILNAKAHNKHLTDEYLEKLTNFQLLRLTHPIDRIDFMKSMSLDFA